jgi:hypothetical protein
MSGSSFPQSVADRISTAFTLVTIIALVWLIAAVPQESGATAAPEHAVAARQVDDCDDGAGPGASDHPAQAEAPQRAPAQLIAAF